MFSPLPLRERDGMRGEFFLFLHYGCALWFVLLNIREGGEELI